MKLGNKLLTFLLTAGLTSGIINTAKAESISGFIHDSKLGISAQNIPVKIYRKPSGGSTDTLYTNTSPFGDYWESTNNFIPEAQIGDTLELLAHNGTSQARLKFLAGAPYNNELTLDGYTASVPSVKDTVFINPNDSLLQAQLILYKNQNQPVNWIFNKKLTPFNYFDLFVDFKNQDSTFSQGDSFKLKVHKTRNDSTYYTEIKSTVDLFWGDAMKVNASNSIHNGAFHEDTLYFPQNVSVFKDLQIDSVWTTEAVGGYVYPKALVKSNRTSLSDSSKYYFTITENGSPFYADSLDKKLLAGQRDTITFSACPQGGNFTHVLQCSTSTDGDATPENNTKQKTISGPMAVELSYFGAMPYDKGIRLEWITQSSINSFLWEIYRGQNSDTLRYDLIATQPGDGNSNQPRHYYHDDECAEGLNWYKLGEVGFSGEKTFYGPINAFAQTAGALRPGKFKAYPNPARRLLDVRVDRAGNYGIYNVLGQKLGEVRNGADGKSSSDIRGKQHPAGIYFIKQEESGETQKVQVVK